MRYLPQQRKKEWKKKCTMGTTTKCWNRKKSLAVCRTSGIRYNEKDTRAHWPFGQTNWLSRIHSHQVSQRYTHHTPVWPFHLLSLVHIIFVSYALLAICGRHHVKWSWKLPKLTWNASIRCFDYIITIICIHVRIILWDCYQCRRRRRHRHRSLNFQFFVYYCYVFCCFSLSPSRTPLINSLSQSVGQTKIPILSFFVCLFVFSLFQFLCLFWEGKAKNQKRRRRRRRWKKWKEKVIFTLSLCAMCVFIFGSFSLYSFLLVLFGSIRSLCVHQRCHSHCTYVSCWLPSIGLVSRPFWPHYFPTFSPANRNEQEMKTKKKCSNRNCAHWLFLFWTIFTTI